MVICALRASVTRCVTAFWAVMKKKSQPKNATIIINFMRVQPFNVYASYKTALSRFNFKAGLFPPVIIIAKRVAFYGIT